MKKIRIIIADDNKALCHILEKFLTKHNDIEILGIAYTDEEEIKMIEDLKPEIVITDLMRKHRYTGLDIIRKYYIEYNTPEFLVISADLKKAVINNGPKVAGYIKKPFNNYEIVYSELRRIKDEVVDEKYNN